MYDIYISYDICTHMHTVSGGGPCYCCSLFFNMTMYMQILSVLISQPDPKQKTIYDLFQRTFSESRDDTDELLLLEAADACCELDSGSALQDTGGETCSVSPPKKRRIEDFFKV